MKHSAKTKLYTVTFSVPGPIMGIETVRHIEALNASEAAQFGEIEASYNPRELGRVIRVSEVG